MSKCISSQSAAVAVIVTVNSDPQRDLNIRSPRTIWEIIKGLYRGYNGSI